MSIYIDFVIKEHVQGSNMFTQQKEQRQSLFNLRELISEFIINCLSVYLNGKKKILSYGKKWENKSFPQ